MATSQGVLGRTKGHVRNFTTARTLAIPRYVLRASLDFGQSRVGAFFVARFSVYRHISVSKGGLRLLYFIICGGGGRYVKLPALNVVTTLLCQTVSVGPRRRMNFSVYVVRVLFSLVDGCALLPLFLAKVLYNVYLPHGLLLVEVFHVFYGIRTNVFHLHFSPYRGRGYGGRRRRSKRGVRYVVGFYQ